MSVCNGNGGRLPALRITRRGKPHVTRAANAFHAAGGATSRCGYPIACNEIACIAAACVAILSTVRTNPLYLRLRASTQPTASKFSMPKTIRSRCMLDIKASMVSGPAGLSPK